MNSPIIAVALTLIALAVFIYVVVKLARRGLSKRYDRPTKSTKPENKWNALNAGEDPTL